MADLLFDWFGFNQTSKAGESKQNKQDVSRTVILSLMLVFSDYSDLSPYGECSLTPASNNVRGCLGTNSMTRLHDFLKCWRQIIFEK